jgi:subtilisin family serine protease
MKTNRLFYILLFVILLFGNVSGQDYYLYVSVTDTELKPKQKGEIYTNNDNLNNILNKNEVFAYYQSFPNAKNPELLDFYEMHFNGKVDTLKNELLSYGFYDDIYKCDYYDINSCDNPIQINDTWIANNWLNNYALELLDAQCAWNITTGNSNISVGVIDTEFDVDHEDLENQIISVDGTQTYFQDHGTLVSSCVAAETNNNKGIAAIGYNTKIKGYCANSQTLWNQIWKAYQDNVDVINVSWTGIGAYPNILAVEEIVDNGTVLIVAAGNSPNATCHSAYADVSGVINVSGVDHNNYHQPTGHAHNEWVDVCVMSTNVSVCKPNNSYGGGWGTSFAAPQVSGVVSLMLSIMPCLTPEEIENILKFNAVPIEDGGNYPNELGAGRVDAYRLLKFLNGEDDYIVEQGEYIIINEPRYFVSDIIIETNGTLSIESNIYLNEQVNITVKQGGQLIIDGGNITPFCNNHWQGIEVKDGGTLEIKNNGAIDMFDYLKINEGATLVYREGASMDLYNSESYIEIIGDLYIEDNAIFTYTGDGYIKFSNPGGDANNNIFCGSGASIVLQGSGQSDKIMEVQQSSVRFPAELSSFELRDGKIEMGAYARMLAEVVSGNENHPIILDNIKITSDDGTYNNHRSFFFWGQPNITVNDCVFEYGQYGLYNYTYWGSPLTVTNSTFRYNQTGLYMYDKGLTLTNCTFDYNTQVGLHADNMSFVSGLSNCKFNNNNEGINYQGSSNADLNLSTCEILNSDNDGIVTEGYFDLDLNCTWVRNNQDGISTNLGTKVDIANDARNDLSNNVNAIRLNNGYLLADNGYNNLSSSNYAVIGEAVIRCNPGTPPDLVAEHNTWDAYNNDPSYLLNHKLWAFDCNQTNVKIIDTDTDDIFCYHFIFIGRDLESGVESGSNNDILLAGELNESLSAQVDNLELSMQEANTAADCQQLLSESITLMGNVYGIETAEAYYQSNRIWSNIHNIVDRHYKIIDRNSENLSFNQSVDQVMQLNEQLMLDADAIAYYEYALDNALLERLRGNFDESLLLLDNLIPELEGMDKEIAYVNRWICHIEAEREAALRNITPEEFMDAVVICNTDYENTLESLSDNLETDENAEETSTAPEIHSVPNPNNGNFTLEISECTEGSSVRITNVYSQPVFTQTFTESGTQTVQITGLSQGHYTVYYLENDAVISSENIVVE